MSKVLGFRMRSGEDVLARVVDNESFSVKEGTFTVVNPCVPVRNPESGDTQLLKWSPYAPPEQEFIFSTADYVATPYDPWSELVDVYLSVTSGIVLAPKANRVALIK